MPVASESRKIHEARSAIVGGWLNGDSSPWNRTYVSPSPTSETDEAKIRHATTS
jgi:hypothetical protein